ncbi:MAG: VOC family protein, partial [Synergistaceae bacterium]|nr:VOC family protein [Synergistaceae bacterium]
MMSRFIHCNINVRDAERSKEFYGRALGLSEVRRKKGPNFTLIYLGDGTTDFQLELTCLHDHPGPYDLGENESHIAFTPEDFAAARRLHDEMGCVCFDNAAMGIYFIEDP